ncbi:MAG: PAS domain S-box protein [Chthoniobacterales bacterium]
MTATFSTRRVFPAGARWLLEVLALAGIYFLTARLGLLMALPGGHVTPVWPPSGIALAALLSRGQRLWLGIWLGSFAANILDFYGSPANLATGLAVSAAYGIGASLTALWGAQLLQRFVDKRHPLERVPDVCAFMLLGGVVSCLVSATIGVTTLDLAGFALWSGYGQAWLTWWLGDVGGVFIVAPLFLVWTDPRRRLTIARWVELLGGFGLLVAVTYYVFIEHTTVWSRDRGFTFALFPFLIWAALRFGRRGAASAAGLVALLAVWGTIHGFGPFKLGSRNESLLALELFLSVISFTALCIATMVREADRKRRQVLEQLESRVAERTASLQRAQEQYRSIFNNAIDGIFRTSPDGRFLVANPVAARIFGFDSPEQLIAERGDIARQGYVDPSRREEFLRLMAAQGVVNSFEFEAYRKDGSRVWISENTRAVYSPDGAIEYFEGTFEDVTARKQAEAELREENVRRRLIENELRESEARFRLMFEKSAVGMALMTVDSVFRQTNAAFCALLGRTEAEVVGHNTAEFTHPEDIEKSVNPQTKVREDGVRIVDLEKRYLRKDGATVWAHVTAVLHLDEEAVPLYWIAIIEDISERKKTEEALRRSEEKWKALFDLAPVGISVLDREHNVVDVNRALEKITRLSREELLNGSSRRRVYLNADGTHKPTENIPSVRAVAEKRPVNDVETGIVSENGEIIWTRVSVAPLDLPDASAVVITQDITEGKRTQQAQDRWLSLTLATLESTADGILVVNTDGKIVTFNRLFAQMWRLSEEVLASKEDADALESVLGQLTEPEKFLEKVRYLYGHPEEESFDRLVFKDGRVFERYSRPQLIGGEVAGRVWSFRDITERKKTQAALRESEERFRFLAEVTNDAIWDWDLVTNQLWWNEGFEALFGYDRGEIEKTIDSWYNRIHPAERARVISGIHRVIDEGGTTWSDEYRFLCKDGSYAYVLDRGQVIRNPDGKALRMVGGMRDLTERNLAEAAVQALPGELLRAQDEERRRIARELHDSTAQELAVVSMNLGRLEEWMEGKDPWAENLLADSLAVLTQGNRDLRTLAYLLHPPMLEELGLLGALRDYVEGFSARSGIQVELKCTEDFERCSPEIETALFRVVQESLSNVHRHSASEVALVKLIRSGDLIELTITDRGKGLPRGLLLGTADKARVGVGISGMRQRIIQLQGHLEIVSDEGGTTVCAVLPSSVKREFVSEPSA